MKTNVKYLKTNKTSNVKKKIRIKPMPLYSSISNVNIKKETIIPLSYLMNCNLTNTNRNKNKKKHKKIKSLGKLPLDIYQRNNILTNFDSFNSQKLPLIKVTNTTNNFNNLNDNNNKNNGIKGSYIDIIFNKFEQFDHKFRKQERIAANIIERGDKLLKLKSDYIKDDDKFKYYTPKRNYLKKQYSKLLKRIKDIQML